MSAFQLDTFTEGYAKAIRSAHPEIGDAPFAPETLARIIEDCEFRVASEGIRWASDEAGRNSGRVFWRLQQDNDLPSFPPLTVTTRDDGEVLLVDEARPAPTADAGPGLPPSNEDGAS